MRRRTTTCLVAALTMIGAGCAAPDTAGSPRSPLPASTRVSSVVSSAVSATPGPTATENDAAEDLRWSYEGEFGPERWGELPGAEACAQGHRQSPIDLTRAEVTDLPDLEFAYRRSPLVVTDTGHTIQAQYAPGSTLTLDGVEYELGQIHHHAPAEHRVDGEEFAAELHLVHTTGDDGYAVVGVLLREGGANPALQRIIDAIPDTVGATASPGASLDATELLPRDRRTYRYDGSLTAPPCTEGVRWSVMVAPVTASAAQLEALQDASGRNNRPLQERGDRSLRRDAAAH